MKRLVGLVHRFVYATLFALVSWLSCVMPLGERAEWQTWTCKVLDWPVATVGLLFPRWKGVDVFYDGVRCDFCSPAELMWGHLVLAVPVYVVLFYVLPFVLWLVRKWRSRSGGNAGAAAVGSAHPV
jgi:hypothetical protein